MAQITADWIYSPHGMLRNHLMEVSPEGEILDLRPMRKEDQARYYEGTLSPGFINAHCHLELSVLRGQIPEHSGMVDFVGQVVRKRKNFSEAEQEHAAREALDQMITAGTVALGDISNTALTAPVKRGQSTIATHTFVELLGLVPEKASQIIQNGRALLAAFAGLPASLSPHAPYSMSAALLARLYEQDSERMSIHLLESKEERLLFDQQSGPFLDFFAQLKLPLPPFPGQGALGQVLNHYQSSRPYLLVHLTEAQTEELALLRQSIQEPWFCLCPLSNLYIHGTFPRVEQFLPYRDRVCLGTDSLASNHQLDIWAEVLAIHRRYPELDGHTLLSWASFNGAKALGLADRLGSFQIGLYPGVLCLPIKKSNQAGKFGRKIQRLFNAKVM